MPRHDAGAPERALAAIAERVIACRKCPRLVEWREEVAACRTRRFAAETYWGRPVPGFGDAQARLLIVGLAPAAHGANRTGRMFTGDRSGLWLYRALHRAGFADRAESVSADDGLRLRGCLITAAVRCAPPDNKPLPAERDTCAHYLDEELTVLLPRLEVIVALGGIAFDATRAALARAGWTLPPRTKFAHAAAHEAAHPDGRSLLVMASYHPSQQNTQTGRLTEPMFDAIWTRAAEVLAARTFAVAKPAAHRRAPAS